MVKWRCHTPELFKRIMETADPKETAILINPLNIFRSLLVEVAERCSEIDDPKLNALMCRLTLYEIADPTQKGYNEKLLNKILREGKK